LTAQVAEAFAIARMIHFSVVSRFSQEAARWEPKGFGWKTKLKLKGTNR